MGVIYPLTMLPLTASAQSAIAGLVTDESGAVLPGVTVDATSPVLIERSRSVVTDDQGRYRIVDLRPGLYKLSFTLTGFSTIVRDGIELECHGKPSFALREHKRIRACADRIAGFR